MQQRVLEIIRENEGKDAKLLAILHDIQEEFGYISEEAVEILAEKLGKKPGEIYDTASFYSFFTFKPARHIIRVCNGIVCNLKGSERIIKAIEEHYGIRDGEVTEDGNFMLQVVECIGRCEGPPAMLVDDDSYGNLTPERAIDILRGYEE